MAHRSVTDRQAWQTPTVIGTGIDEVSLSVPAHIAYARIVRLAAASLAVNQGMSFGEIDDLRSVVDEAVDLLLEVDGGSDSDTLDFDYRFSAGKFEIEARRTGDGVLRREKIKDFIDNYATLIDGFDVSDIDRWFRLHKTPAGDA